MKEKPRFSSARDSRGFAYKYYPIKGDEKHRVAVLGGRCFKCGKVTDAYCDKCNEWICENHLVKAKVEGECYCLECGDNQSGS
jgi:hypothetical protein